MTEVTEYSLVFMVSTLFVAGSLATYNSFSSLETQIQFRADFVALSNLASQAIENGSSKGTLSFPSATVSCQGSELSLASGSLAEKLSLPMFCDFVVNVDAGVRVVEFTTRASQLFISVV